MKSVDWNDFPGICLELIDEVQVTGQSIDITRDGRPELRLIPIDDATRTLYEAERAR
jgi:antitoxin (DNA-binding transcriptional repressor) of toxin-antitoxin stability system